MGLTAERLQIEVGADTSEADRKLNDLGNTSGGGRWTGMLATAGVAAFAAVGAAGVAVVGTGVKVAADMEQAEIAFTTMLGSGEKAKGFLEELKAFAAQTPFEFPELQTAASSLIAAGFEAGKVIPIMTTLGNVTSGMGTGAEGVQRATVALQQMSAAGKITGEDLNQLRDAGVPVFDLLSAATGKTKEEIAAMAQAGKLGKVEMEALFKALETGKGLERFNGLMEKQSKSLLGLLSSLKDNVGQSLAGMMAPVVTELEAALPEVTAVIGDALDAIGPDITSLASGLIGALKAILPSLVPILGAVAGALGDTFEVLAPAVAELLPAFLAVIEALLPVLPSLAGVAVALSPVLVVLANALAAIITAIPTPVLTALVVAFLAFTQVIAPLMALAATISALGGVVAAAAAFFPGLTAAVFFLLSPVGLVIAAVAALAAIAFVVIKNWEPIKAFFGDVWAGIQAVVGAAVGFIQNNIGTFMRVVLGIMTGGLSEVLGFVIRHWDQIKTAVTGGIGAVVGFVTGLPGKIISALSGLGGSLLKLGADAFQSMWNGINSIIPKLLSLAAGLVAKLVAKLNPANWFSTPEEHYRMLFGAAFTGISDEARGALRPIGRSVGRILAATDMSGAFAGAGGIGPASFGGGVGRAQAAVERAGTVVQMTIEGSVWREADLFEMIRGRLSDAGIAVEFG